MKNYEAIRESNILSQTMPCFVDRACFLGNRMLDNELCIYRNALEEMGSLKFGGVCSWGIGRHLAPVNKGEIKLNLD